MKYFGLTLFLFTSLATAVKPSAVVTKQAMVVTSQHLATQVGLDILRQGGNAIDAAVAIGYTLAVVEPCCGNIGGGGFLLLRKSNGEAFFLNFRETAPADLKPQQFLNKDGTIDGKKLTNSYLSIGVPGTVMGLNTALKKFGTMPLHQVMAPAIYLAEHGFKLDSTNAKQLENIITTLNKDPNVKRNFTNAGIAFRKGEIFKQLELANTLKLIAKHGSYAFYKGKIAKKLIAANIENGGVLTAADLANYHVAWEKPLSCYYHGYTVTTAPLPSSGGVILCEMLQILANYSLKSLDYHSTKANHYMIEAMRYAYADRINALGDPAFVKDQTPELLATKHIQTIVAQIKSAKKNHINACKTPNHQEHAHTTHYSIIDKYGNAVAVTYTLNDFFGAKISANGTGFLLNDEIDDFTILSNQPNHPASLAGGAANLLTPQKHPLSSMTPTIVSKNNQTILVTGSPGGATIPTTVLQILVNFFDFGMNLQQAVDAPRFHNQCIPDIVYIEPGAFSNRTFKKLQQDGYFLLNNGPFKHPEWGAAASIYKDPATGSLQGANDIRRPDGLAAGF